MVCKIDQLRGSCVTPWKMGVYCFEFSSCCLFGVLLFFFSLVLFFFPLRGNKAKASEKRNSENLSLKNIPLNANYSVGQQVCILIRSGPMTPAFFFSLCMRKTED